VNFASDSYWGDPERFKFRAAIDNYTTTTELVEGGDRTVKTSFQIKIAGYIVSDAINTNIGNPNRFFSKAALKFGLETAGSTEILNARAGTPTTQAPARFFDTALTGVSPKTEGMSSAEIQYIGLNTTALADTKTATVATFLNKTFATPPANFAAITQDDFKVFINGQFISTNSRIVAEAGPNITVTFSGLGYPIDNQDQAVLVGKFT
jgi:hypothetical protein